MAERGDIFSLTADKAEKAYKNWGWEYETNFFDINVNAEEFFNLLVREGCIPNDVSGWVFLDTSSHKGQLEFELATILNAAIKSGQLQCTGEKPHIIASDVAYDVDNTGNTAYEKRRQTKFDAVVVSMPQASAFDLPYPKNFADVEYDRLGALHVLASQLLRGNWAMDVQGMQEVILEAIQRETACLKPGGRLLLDAHKIVVSDEMNMSLPESTTILLYKIFAGDKRSFAPFKQFDEEKGKNDFIHAIQGIGFECRIIGGGKERMLVLTKNSAEVK